MFKQLIHYALPTTGHQFKAQCYHIVQLSAKFQIWCRQFGTNDTESLALWIGRDERQVKVYFSYMSPKVYNALLAGAEAKLPESKAPVDLTDYGNSTMMFSTMTLNTLTAPPGND